MYWEFWIGGAALTAVALGHWLVVGRLMAVSGRFTALVNGLRFGEPQQPDMSTEEMLAAMRAMTREQFGEDAVEDPIEDAQPEALPVLRPPQRPSTHVLFLLCLVAGGALASLTGRGLQPALSLRSEVFPQVFGAGTSITAVTLLLGGVLIGFGTRMAAGCTSGHGLCGVSRFQVGSLAATAAFFGAGIAVSMLLGALM